MDATADREHAVGLVDLTMVPLDELFGIGSDLIEGDNVLAHSVRRVAAAASEGSNNPVSGFSSAL